MTYPPVPPAHDRSPWSSPAVLVAIAAGLLVVIGGVLAAILFIPGSGDSNDSQPAPTVVQSSPDNSSVPPQPSASSSADGSSPDPASPSAAPPSSPAPVPTVPGTYANGFFDGPRCDVPADHVVMVGTTDRSQIIICQVGTQTGRLYYKGRAPAGDITVHYPTRSGSTFVATNKTVTYTVTPDRLLITDGGKTLADETMTAFWVAPQ